MSAGEKRSGVTFEELLNSAARSGASALVFLESGERLTCWTRRKGTLVDPVEFTARERPALLDRLQELPARFPCPQNGNAGEMARARRATTLRGRAVILQLRDEEFSVPQSLPESPMHRFRRTIGRMARSSLLG